MLPICKRKLSDSSKFEAKRNNRRPFCLVIGPNEGFFWNQSNAIRLQRMPRRFSRDSQSDSRECLLFFFSYKKKPLSFLVFFFSSILFLWFFFRPHFWAVVDVAEMLPNDARDAEDADVDVFWFLVDSSNILPTDPNLNTFFLKIQINRPI